MSGAHPHVVKFMVNLSIGASVLPIAEPFCRTYEMAFPFSVMSGLACLVVLAALLLPQPAHRLDRQPAE